MEPIETPVISTKEKKKTLSFKPKKQVKVQRHVFAAPCKRYWPVLDESKEADLNNLLERTLVAAKIPQTKNRKTWKKLSKEDRTNMRKGVECDEATESAKAARLENIVIQGLAYYEVPDKPPQIDVRSSLILGLNAVSRGLEKCETSVVLLAQDIDPPILGHHVSDLCLVKRVPLIVMQSLKQTTKDSLGFSCMALGLKQGQTHFTELEEHIIELSTMFPIPDGPMYKKVDNDNASDSDSDSDNSSFDDQPSNLIQEKWNPERLKDIYLHRTSRKERIFIPELPKSVLLPAKETPKFDQDFIPFGTCNTNKPNNSLGLIACSQSETEHYRFTTPLGIDEMAGDAKVISLTKKRKMSNYMPLVVKVVQSNPNKNKKHKKAK